MWFDFFHHLGKIYQAYRVMQDSGIWTYDVEAIAKYAFARMGMPVPEDPRS